MKKYRVAIIGRSGKGNYGHGLDKVWKEIPQAEIVGIADENPAGLKKTAEKHYGRACNRINSVAQA